MRVREVRELHGSGVRASGTHGARRSRPAGVLLAIGLLLAASACSLAGPQPPARGGAGEEGDGRGADAPAAPAPDTAGDAPAADGGEPAWRVRPLPPPLTSPFDEVRGLWVVRFSLTTPESVRAVVRRADEAGFNTLLVQVRGRGDAYYRSGLEPPAEGLRGASPGFDPLALLLEEAHARGIHVHAWMNVFLVAGVGPLPSDPAHVVNRNPEWLAVPRALGRELHAADPGAPAYRRRLHAWAAANTDRVEGLYLSPPNPRVQEHVYRIALDLVTRYEVDGLHLDYIRFPDAGFDYSRGALEAFREWLAGRMDEDERLYLEERYRADPLSLPAGAPEEWDAFRRWQVSALVDRVVRGVKARRPDVLVSAAVFPDAEAARRHRFQDWRHWLRTGLVDVAVPMAYTPDAERFRTLVAGARRDVDPDRVWAGIGVYRTTFDGTLDQARAARAEGVGGFVLFSYDWAVSEGRGPEGAPFLEGVGRALF